MIIDGHAHLSATDYGHVDLYLGQLQAAGLDRGLAAPGGALDLTGGQKELIPAGNARALLRLE